MSTLLWILLATLAAGLLSAAVAGAFLCLPRAYRQAVLPHMISFATGTLLAAALVAQLPEALEAAGADQYRLVALVLLGGLLLFFVLEKAVLWRHCHHDQCEAHAPASHHRDAASGTLVLVGDAIHNFVDGTLIAAAFLTDVELGILTALAVTAHEIPQELGDVAVLLNSGLSRLRVLALNVLVGLASVLGGLVGYLLLGSITQLLPYALAVAAASFLYVAVADLIPGLHQRLGLVASVQQITFIAAGIGTVIAMQALISHGH
ncbi:MAG: ZIP family metal transporter [Pseudomonadota bacterium]